MTSLNREQGRLMLAESVAASRSEATIQQALLVEDSSLFYDPLTESDSLPGDASASDFASIDRAPQLQNPTSSVAWLAPWPIAESVFFVYRDVESGHGLQRRVPIATAFVLSVPLGVLDSSHRTPARFLVTARHVVDPEWAHCSSQNPASIEVRLNRRSGGVGYARILLEDAHMRHYFIPADATSDIAVIPLDDQLIPDLESYKFVDTPFNLLPTESDLRTIPTAQPVVTASLRTQVPADPSAFPVLGFGVLSSISADPVNIHCGWNSAARPLHVWFIDAWVQQGVSGAPVYTSLVRNGETMPSAVLLGVQAIAWPDRGVAGITPASALADLIHAALLGHKQDENRYRGAAP